MLTPEVSQAKPPKASLHAVHGESTYEEGSQRTTECDNEQYSSHHNEVRRVQLGAPETTRNTWLDIVSQVPIQRIGSPLLYTGGILRPRSFGNFSAFQVYSFGGLPETPVIGRDNMSGLKNWLVFESGHVRYRNPTLPSPSNAEFARP